MTPRISMRTVPANDPTPTAIPDVASITPPGISSAAAVSVTGSQHPRPLDAITSSAHRITSRTIESRSKNATRADVTSWQQDAWDMYDLVGEQHFLANVLAGRGAQAKLYVGRLSHTDPLAAPEPVEDERAQAILDVIGVTSAGRSQLMLRSLIGFFIAGEGYIVGIPKRMIPDSDESKAPAPPETSLPLEANLEDLEWRSMSTKEVKITRDTVKLSLPELGGSELEVAPDDIYLIHAMRPHPAESWKPDSPTLSSLPVLRELVGLTMAISGQIDSRLAGAGIFAISDKIVKAMKQALGLPEDGPEDPFTEQLIDAMVTPISDRSNASAFVPLVITVPNDDQPVSDMMHHLGFDNPFDEEMRPLRDEAIRRLALGQDAPPELLLGMAGMNHWGAWLVSEDVVTTHLEPPLALLCDALSTEFLRPSMRAAELWTDEEIDEFVVWYDVSHLIVRPNRSDDAIKLYQLGELSGEALRREAGFDENDAPDTIGDQHDPAVDLALQLVAQAPSLMQSPGLPSVVEQIRAVQQGREATAAAAEEPPADGEPAGDAPDLPVDDERGGGIPRTDSDPATPPGQNAAHPIDLAALERELTR